VSLLTSVPSRSTHSGTLSDAAAAVESQLDDKGASSKDKGPSLLDNDQTIRSALGTDSNSIMRWLGGEVCFALLSLIPLNSQINLKDFRCSPYNRLRIALASSQFLNYCRPICLSFRNEAEESAFARSATASPITKNARIRQSSCRQSTAGCPIHRVFVLRDGWE
jgi:hypothetical protein